MAMTSNAIAQPSPPRIFRAVFIANFVYLLILMGALALQNAAGKPVIAAGLLLALFLIFLPASIMIGAGIRAAYATRSGKILFLTITVLLSVLLAQDMIPDEALRLIAWCWIGVGQPVMLLGLIARAISRKRAILSPKRSIGTADRLVYLHSCDEADAVRERFKKIKEVQYLNDLTIHLTCPSDPSKPPPVLPY
jgi:hypothetical protein